MVGATWSCDGVSGVGGVEWSGVWMGWGGWGEVKRSEEEEMQMGIVGYGVF